MLSVPYSGPEGDDPSQADMIALLNVVTLILIINQSICIGVSHVILVCLGPSVRNKTTFLTTTKSGSEPRGYRAALGLHRPVVLRAWSLQEEQQHPGLTELQILGPSRRPPEPGGRSQHSVLTSAAGDSDACLSVRAITLNALVIWGWR